MALRKTTTQWGSLARLLHWIIFLLVILQFVTAWSGESLPDESAAKLRLLARHMSFGLTILLLMIVRILWRLGNPTPTPPAGTRIETLVAHGTLGLLYLLLLVIPLSGWVMAGGHGDAVAWFGAPMPALVQKDSPLGRPAHEMHELLGWVLLVLIALHILAALKHHFVTRNDVLRRMRPW
ncbi:MAG: cytochrome b [Gammaproteobacteria bacterium]|nr:cytochrome b [Gammaproteobacteria bacterium]